MLQCKQAVSNLNESMSEIGYSLLTNYFSEQKERVLAFGETAAGLGLMMGPIIGGTLYVKFGYFWCYSILAGFLFVSVFITLIVMPGSINSQSST